MANLPDPITRKEQYLAKMAGMETEVPAEPITREEQYLEAILDNGGGGGGTKDYDELTNQPQIDGVTLSGNKTAEDLGLATDDPMTGASDSSGGSKGLVPAPSQGDQNKFLAGDGTWNTPASPISTVAVDPGEGSELSTNHLLIVMN